MQCSSYMFLYIPNRFTTDLNSFESYQLSAKFLNPAGKYLSKVQSVEVTRVFYASFEQVFTQ